MDSYISSTVRFESTYPRNRVDCIRVVRICVLEVYRLLFPTTMLRCKGL